MKLQRFIFCSLTALCCLLFPPVSADESDLHITIWAEYPAYGTPLEGYVDYFNQLTAFVAKNKINRVIFRVQDPGNFPMYQFVSKDKWGQSNVDSTGYFFKYLALNSDFVATGCEIYVLPWLSDHSTWGYPLDDTMASTLSSAVSNDEWSSMDNLQKTVLWIQLANEYVAYYGGGTYINGVVYESEGAHGFPKTTALPAFRTNLEKYLKTPSPAYADNASSAFKLTSASQNNFYTDDCGNVFLHEIYPQYYNLTKGTDPIQVDATSAATLLDAGNYTPLFPESIYTLNLHNKEKLVDTFVELRKPNPALARPDNVHYMFSTELAPPSITTSSKTYDNPYNYRQSTIIGKTGATGSINAFGVQGWSWATFLEFAKAFGETYNTKNIAIFQFNMLPPEWSATTTYATPVIDRSKLRFANPTSVTKKSRISVYGQPIERNGVKNIRLKTIACDELTLECQWTKIMSLYDKKLLRQYYKQGKNSQDYLADYPCHSLRYNLVVQEKKSTTSHALSTIELSPPTITSLKDSAGNDMDTLMPNQQYIVTGSHFGKKPKAWLEYVKHGKTRSIKLRTISSSQPSENLYNGSGSFYLKTPKHWPKSWDHSATHTLVISNKMGITTLEVRTSGS
jgi:hypothetical protein